MEDSSGLLLRVVSHMSFGSGFEFSCVCVHSIRLRPGAAGCWCQGPRADTELVHPPTNLTPNCIPRAKWSWCMRALKAV